MVRVIRSIFLLLLIPGSLFAASPIDVTSDTMVVDRERGVVTFKGGVIATRDDLVIKAEELQVFYGEEREIERIEASGGVTIEKGGITASGEKAEFYTGEERLVLTGDPKVIEGPNRVEGERITLYLKDGRSIVEGGERRRVRAVFVPPEEGR